MRRSIPRRTAESKADPVVVLVDKLGAVLASFQMLPEQPADELLDSIRIADELGYYGCYSADEIYHKERTEPAGAALAQMDV